MLNQLDDKDEKVDQRDADKDKAEDRVNLRAGLLRIFNYLVDRTLSSSLAICWLRKLRQLGLVVIFGDQAYCADLQLFFCRQDEQGTYARHQRATKDFKGEQAPPLVPL